MEYMNYRIIKAAAEDYETTIKETIDAFKKAENYMAFFRLLETIKQTCKEVNNDKK